MPLATSDYLHTYAFKRILLTMPAINLFPFPAGSVDNMPEDGFYCFVCEFATAEGGTQGKKWRVSSEDKTLAEAVMTIWPNVEPLLSLPLTGISVTMNFEEALGDEEAEADEEDDALAEEYESEFQDDVETLTYGTDRLVVADAGTERNMPMCSYEGYIVWRIAKPAPTA